jgi:hypothetical protein
MGFIPLLQTTKNGHRGLNGGLIDEDLLEATFEGRVLLDVLAIFL